MIVSPFLFAHWLGSGHRVAGDAGVQRLLGWRPHRTALWTGKAEVQTDAPWCWGGPSARAVNDKLSRNLAVANHKIADDADGCIVRVCGF